MGARRILLVYGTTDGQTERIASRMAGVMKRHGCLVATFKGDSLSSAYAPADFDGIMVGASLRYGKHQSYIASFVRDHVGTLNARPSAFFSVSCAAASPKAEGVESARDSIATFLRTTGWQPRATTAIAGALMYRQYNPILRLVMKRIARKAGLDTDTSRNHEYTDWEQVDEFADSFVAELNVNAPAGPVQPVASTTTV
jgi:menaquinone-dependent protoporphyrinogen oxidase